ATASDQATEGLAFSGDIWQALVTMSPPPRPATSRTALGALWRQARRTEHLVVV
ncbi:hypothetical protein A2U01_0096519, partial [Trifolium medium]|nr:hypothetical protein [Trifolium medium]